MKALIETLSRFTEDPSGQTELLAQKMPLGMAMGGYLLGATCLALWFEGGDFSLAGFVFGWLFFAVIITLTGFVSSCTSHLFLELTGANGRATGLFVLGGISSTAMCALFPLEAIVRINNTAAGPHFSAFFLAVMIQAILLVFMIGRAYKVSSAKAVLAVVMPFMLAFATMMFLALFALGMLIAAIIAALM